jgi:hypothetical protein
MIGAMKLTASVLAAALAVLGLTGIATAGNNKPPAVGDYVADLDIEGTYQQGAWRVIKEDGKRKIVSSAQYNGIYYPDPGECDNYNIPITASSIPISKGGKFRHSETTPVSGTDTKIKVTWKGKWKSATKVIGTIKLASGNCESTNDFEAAKVPGS